MSAFFVSRETIHDAVQLWVQYHPQPRSQDTLNAIGRSLWKMNAEALRQRYPSIVGTPEGRDYDGAAEAYVFFPPESDMGQLAKSTHCLRYQCSEGDIGEGNERWDDTYHMLSAICDAVGEPAGYDDAQWDRVA